MGRQKAKGKNQKAKVQSGYVNGPLFIIACSEAARHCAPYFCLLGFAFCLHAQHAVRSTPVAAGSQKAYNSPSVDDKWNSAAVLSGEIVRSTRLPRFANHPECGD